MTVFPVPVLVGVVDVDELAGRAAEEGGDGFAGGATGGSSLAGGSGSTGGGGNGFTGDGSTGSGSGVGSGTDTVAVAGSGTDLSGELRGGASGGRASNQAGDAESRDPNAVRGGDDNVARSGTGTAGGFRGGASGGRASADAGDGSGRSEERKSGERERLFEDERDAQRIRLVGGNRLISVQGDGVNLHPEDHGLPAATGVSTPR